MGQIRHPNATCRSRRAALAAEVANDAARLEEYRRKVAWAKRKAKLDDIEEGSRAWEDLLGEAASYARWYKPAIERALSREKAARAKESKSDEAEVRDDS